VVGNTQRLWFSLLRNYIGKLMERVKTGITFRHMDQDGKEVSEHVASTKDDMNQADDLATVFTPQVLKVCSRFLWQE
jgi:hypothetical protein